MFKNKKILWLFAGLATNLSLASFVATSCGRHEEPQSYDPLNYDQKFGFNKATYDKLEGDFRSALSKKIYNEDKHAKPGEEQDKWDKKIAELGGHKQIMDQLENNLSCFRNEFFGENASHRSESFNTKTESLINFAKQNYDIELDRQIDAKSLQDEATEIKTSYTTCLKQALENAYGVGHSKVAETLEEFTKKFDSVYEKAIASSNDMVQILSQLRLDFIEYFVGLNDELTQLVAQKQLKQFLGDYKIDPSIEKINKNNYYWDTLENQFPVASAKKEISDIVDDVFDITKIEDSTIFATDAPKPINWEDLKIVGYKLVPYIVDYTSDSLNNAYRVNVDWCLVNESMYNEKLKKYKGDASDPDFKKEIDAISAHSWSDDEASSDLLDTTTNDQSQSKKITENSEYLCSYRWPVSQSYAQKALFNTFVNNDSSDANKLEFSWLDDPELTGIDCFVSKDALDDQDAIVQANLSKLAFAGLQINNKPIVHLVVEMETNTNEEIAKDPAKLCLKYCDLSGEYSIGNILNTTDTASRKLDVKLNLSYKNNDYITGDDADIASCNPIAKNLDDEAEQNKTIEVDQEILGRSSEIIYDRFITMYKNVKDDLNVDKLDEALEKASNVITSLTIAAVVLTAIFVVILVVLVFLYNQATEQTKKRINSACIILSIAAGILVVGSIGFSKACVNPLNTFKKGLHSFMVNSESKYTFIQKMNEYDKYYSEYDKEKNVYISPTNKENFDKLQNESKIEDFLSVACYFDDYANNQDFNDYKQARKDNHVWSIDDCSYYSASFWLALTCMIAAVVVAFILLIIVLWCLSRQKIDNPGGGKDAANEDFVKKIESKNLNDPQELQDVMNDFEKPKPAGYIKGGPNDGTPYYKDAEGQYYILDENNKRYNMMAPKPVFDFEKIISNKPVNPTNINTNVQPIKNYDGKIYMDPNTDSTIVEHWFGLDE